MNKTTIQEKSSDVIYGYAGQILRVDLTKGDTTAETLEETHLRRYLGGATLGIKYVYDEVSEFLFDVPKRFA